MTANKKFLQYLQPLSMKLSINLFDFLMTFQVSGLFKGLLSPLTGIAALNAVLFTSYGFAKTRLESSQGFILICFDF